MPTLICPTHIKEYNRDKHVKRQMQNPPVSQPKGLRGFEGDVSASYSKEKGGNGYKLKPERCPLLKSELEMIEYDDYTPFSDLNTFHEVSQGVDSRTFFEGGSNCWTYQALSDVLSIGCKVYEIQDPNIREVALEAVAAHFGMDTQHLHKFLKLITGEFMDSRVDYIALQRHLEEQFSNPGEATEDLYNFYTQGNLACTARCHVRFKTRQYIPAMDVIEGDTDFYRKTRGPMTLGELADSLQVPVLLANDSGLHHSECESGWVYLMQAVGTNRFKIGLSRDPKARLQKLNSSQSSHLIRLVHAFHSPSALAHERSLHKRHRSQRVHGEWFELSLLQVHWICQINEENIG